jgi:hypothetical protein
VLNDVADRELDAAHVDHRLRDAWWPGVELIARKIARNAFTESFGLAV